MTVSADTLRLAIIREATPGVTPANPAFQLLRATSESLAYTPETQLSNELSQHRMLTDVIVSGGQSGGDLSFEVSSNPGFEILLEAIFGSTWAADFLTVGTTLYTHTLEKRFVIPPDPVEYEFNRFVRALIDAMTLTFSPGGPATGSVTILGGAVQRSDTDLVGATYLTGGTLPVMVGAGVLPIEFNINGTAFTAWCLSNLVLTFRNNGRAITCLGQLGAGEVVLGRFECEITADVYVNKETDELMDAFIDGTEITFSVTVGDSIGNQYTFAFTRVRVQSCTEVAPGTNQDVIMSVTMQALLDEVTAGAPPLPPTDADTCCIVQRVHVSSPWPQLEEPLTVPSETAAKPKAEAA